MHCAFNQIKPLIQNEYLNKWLNETLIISIDQYISQLIDFNITSLQVP